MDGVKRRYHAPTRTASAALTRAAVLEAARELFIAQGYVTTTVADIAARAQVSRPTVFSIGSKPQLFAAVRDVTIAGDDEPVPIVARPGWQGVVDAPDPHESVLRFAEHCGDVNRRYAELNEVLHRSAAAGPEMTALYERSERERRVGARAFITALSSKVSLALPVSASVDVAWALNSPGTYHRLVHERRWAHGRYIDWLTMTLAATLLGD